MGLLLMSILRQTWHETREKSKRVVALRWGGIVLSLVGGAPLITMPTVVGLSMLLVGLSLCLLAWYLDRRDAAAHMAKLDTLLSTEHPWAKEIYYD